MFRCSAFVAVLLMTFGFSSQAIVPQELPSILSLVYSNIPPIRKGTDSRLGFGFRLGEHADFQVVVELGPQKDTRPIAMSDSSSSSKRQVNQNDYRKSRPTSEESTTSASWLQNWSNDMHSKKKKATMTQHKQYQRQKQNVENDTIKKGYLETGPMIPESSLKQLQQLYKMATAQMRPIVVEDTTVADVSADQTSPIDIQSIISPRHAAQIRKTKGEITEELMDVKLE